MSRKHNQTGRSSTAPTFIMLPHWMSDCPAWRDLSPVDRCAWLEIVRLYNGMNNGRIAVDVRTLGQKLGRSKSHAARALIKLEDNGFIETTRLSSFSKRDKKAAEYRLTHVQCDVTFERSSKKFMRWVPPVERMVPPMGQTQQSNPDGSHQRDQSNVQQSDIGPTSGTHIHLSPQGTE